MVAPLGLAPARLERLKTAVAEAAMNAIEHGNDSNAELSVGVSVRAADGELVVRITDRGGGRPIAEAETRISRRSSRARRSPAAGASS